VKLLVIGGPAPEQIPLARELRVRCRRKWLR